MQISLFEEKQAINEIRHLLSSFTGSEHQPDIVLLPELSIPIGYERKLMQTAEAMESIIIAGLDYRIDETQTEPTVSNEAVVIMPSKLRGIKIASRTGIRRIGKTYPAPREKQKLTEIGCHIQVPTHCLAFRK